MVIVKRRNTEICNYQKGRNEKKKDSKKDMPLRSTRFVDFNLLKLIYGI